MGKKEILRRLAALEDAVGISEEIEFADGSKIKIDNRVEDKNARVGDVCKFWDEFENDFSISIHQGYDEFGERHRSLDGMEYMHSKTLNKKEVVELLFGKEIGG